MGAGEAKWKGLKNEFKDWAKWMGGTEWKLMKTAKWMGISNGIDVDIESGRKVPGK